MIVAGLAVLVLAGLLVYQTVQHSRERADLLQRIQAPQAAVMKHADLPPARSVSIDSDEEFWAAKEDSLA